MRAAFKLPVPLLGIVAGAVLICLPFACGDDHEAVAPREAVQWGQWQAAVDRAATQSNNAAANGPVITAGSTAACYRQCDRLAARLARGHLPPHEYEPLQQRLVSKQRECDEDFVNLSGRDRRTVRARTASLLCQAPPPCPACRQLATTVEAGCRAAFASSPLPAPPPGVDAICTAANAETKAACIIARMCQVEPDSCHGACGGVAGELQSACLELLPPDLPSLFICQIGRDIGNRECILEFGCPQPPASCEDGCWAEFDQALADCPDTLACFAAAEVARDWCLQVDCCLEACGDCPDECAPGCHLNCGIEAVESLDQCLADGGTEAECADAYFARREACEASCGGSPGGGPCVNFCNAEYNNCITGEPGGPPPPSGPCDDALETCMAGCCDLGECHPGCGTCGPGDPTSP